MDVRPYIRQQLDYIESQDYAGYDPYDALNSPFLRLLSVNNKWARMAFTQTLRRLPINLRVVLGIRKGHNPKGLGLFLSGYARLYAVEKKQDYLKRIEHLLSLLKRTMSKGYSGNAWGYNFDWQSRLVYRPSFTPTVVNTSFIGHALLDTFEMTGNEYALEMALGTKGFILIDLNRKKEGDVFCFSYSPMDHDYVHNANVLGASLLIRLNKYDPNTELRKVALASLGYCLKYQSEDGAWRFAETNYQKWIDSFHTGFVLESMRHFLNLGEISDCHVQYKKGMDFYSQKFFLEDGTPKYYDCSTYPIDIHSPAEAVYFFSSESQEYKELTDRILSWMISNMWNERGFFYFRKTRHFKNKIPYIRWSQAWGFRALTEYYFNYAKV